MFEQSCQLKPHNLRLFYFFKLISLLFTWWKLWNKCTLQWFALKPIKCIKFCMMSNWTMLFLKWIKYDIVELIFCRSNRKSYVTCVVCIPEGKPILAVFVTKCTTKVVSENSANATTQRLRFFWKRLSKPLVGAVRTA